MKDNSLYTVPETAERLRLSESTTWRLIRSGQLRSVKIGRCRRVFGHAIDDFLQGLS